MRIVVVGAGIIGLSTAWTLLEAGHEVVLVERADGPATGASGRNGAQLSYAFVSPLASPGTLAALPRLLLQRDSIRGCRRRCGAGAGSSCAPARRPRWSAPRARCWRWPT
jgi:D-amino-acid dehydrogenase